MMIGSLTLSSVTTLPDLRMTPSATPSGQQTQQGSTDFGSVLKDLAAGTLDTIRQGEAAAVAGVQGSMPLQSVVDHVMAAERTLQTGIALRDKLVSSYLEVTRMQI
jgi:flagellar hook-basal body complex protein FliE